MPLKIAFQMDPIGAINIDADSTFRIAEEAQALGHELFYYTPDNLAYDEGRVVARGWPLSVRRQHGDHFSLGDEEPVDLSDFDVVWLRQDPPFDMGSPRRIFSTGWRPIRWWLTTLSGFAIILRSFWSSISPI